MKPRAFAHLVIAITLVSTTLAAAPAFAQGGPDTVFLDEHTWVEVRDLIDSGTTTAIIATAGTEQNGPHMVLGKHKFIVRRAAEMMALELGNALVAPVITFVPEGNIDPPSGHMRYAGAITLPNEFFMKLVEYTARSLQVHGFTDIVLIGDSGGNQRGMQAVAEMLNAEWADNPARVHFVGDYYSNNGVNEWLFTQGETEETIGSHAGIRDTSQLMYVAPGHIRDELRAPLGGFEGSGVSGDPSRASAEYGEMALQLKVDAALRQLRILMAQ